MKLSYTLLLTSALLISSAFSQCTQRERKEIRTLSSTEWSDFSAALTATMSGAKPTAYDRLVKIHIDNKDTVHNVANFFTWHRYYLRLFEQELQKHKPNVMLPYWNWAMDSQAPERSIVFSNTRFGGNGGSGGCVTTGAFASWRPHYPSPHCLQRQFDASSKINAFYSSDVITRIISQSADYDALRRAIEFAPHGSVHVGIGGDMALMQSPNDPIFWLHHAYIDKIWEDWQQSRPALAQNYRGQNSDGHRATPADRLPTFNVPVSQVFSTRSLCYTYAELPATSVQPARPTTPPPPATPTAPKAPTVTKAAAPTVTKATTASPTPTPTQTSRWRWWLVRRGNDDDSDDDKAPVNTNVGVSPSDRENLVALRIPAGIKEEWGKMNKIPIQDIRTYEQEYAKVTDKINAIDGYIPPCSLWMREDLLISLKSEVNKFYGTVHGKYVETSAKSIETSITKIKDDVRKQCGGSVRISVDSYKDKLLKVIGTSLPPVTSASYPFTKPLTNEKQQVTY